MINTKIKGSQNEGTIKCFIYEMYRYSSHREESEGTIQERVIAFHLKALNRLHDTFSSIRSSQSIFVRKDLDAHRLSTCALGGGDMKQVKVVGQVFCAQPSVKGASPVVHQSLHWSMHVLTLTYPN